VIIFAVFNEAPKDAELESEPVVAMYSVKKQFLQHYLGYPPMLLRYFEGTSDRHFALATNYLAFGSRTYFSLRSARLGQISSHHLLSANAHRALN
jgi:hypothetical protein